MPRLRWMVCLFLLLPAGTAAQDDFGSSLECAFMKIEFRAYIEGRARVPFETLLNKWKSGVLTPEAMEELPKRQLRRILRAMRTTPFPECK